MKKGVCVITFTATIYIGNIKKVYTSRLGFCGEYNQQTLKVFGAKLKEQYSKQVEAEFQNTPVKPSKIECRVSTKTTECEMLLNGK